MSRRVVVTGMGIVSSYGTGHQNFADAIFKGVSGIHRLSFSTGQLGITVGAEVTPALFNPIDFIDAKLAKRLDPVILFGVAASKMALIDSGLTITEELMPRAGVFIGSGEGGIRTMLKEAEVYVSRFNANQPAEKFISPMYVTNILPNMAAGFTAIELGLRGPSLCPISACASGNDAIGLARDSILSGRTDIMFAGGTDSSLNMLGLAGFNSMRALSRKHDENPTSASRPFDKDRDGFVMSEGSAILVLEEREFALARKARIYAEIVGYGAACDAYNIVAPDPESKGTTEAIQAALDNAGLKPEQIDHINAHGTSTEFNDRSESMAIRKVFGDRTDVLPVTSIKSMTGHPMGAAGAFEAIISIHSLNRQQIPPTINLENQDPDCNIRVITETTEFKMNYILSESFGFGGQNSVLIFKKHNI